MCAHACTYTSASEEEARLLVWVYRWSEREREGESHRDRDRGRLVTGRRRPWLAPGLRGFGPADCTSCNQSLARSRGRREEVAFVRRRCQQQPGLNPLKWRLMRLNINHSLYRASPSDPSGQGATLEIPRCPDGDQVDDMSPYTTLADDEATTAAALLTLSRPFAPSRQVANVTHRACRFHGLRHVCSRFSRSFRPPTRVPPPTPRGIYLSTAPRARGRPFYSNEEYKSKCV